MADALVSFVVKELGAIVKEEVGLLASVEKELENLSSTFSSIQALLVDAERKQVTKEPVRVWLGKIKEVAYEVGDILDEWRIDEIQKVHFCSLFPCLCFKQLKSRHDIGHRIREVKGKLNEISKEKNDFNLEVVNVGEGMSRNRETGSLIDEPVIVGRDEVKEKIIRQLVGETGHKEKPISIVSIVGMGGIGKTTLAQLVCNDERVEACFEKRVWVCVSDPFDVNRIATKVIESLGGSAPKSLDLDTMQHSLRKAVGEKTFLLVLDDVWDENGVLWQKLRVPLLGAAPGSKIVVTTRRGQVAKAMEAHHIHDLDILSDPDCWELFKSIAFKGAEDQECQELMEIGEKIVERCKGVPLAVKAVGSLLRSKWSKRYWKHVFDSEIWARDDIQENVVLPALMLSYDNLPSQLKRCFLFCSVFPKDHEIKKDELIKLWMANDIIKYVEANNDDIEEIGGEIYFDDLLTHSLIQVAEKDIYGNIVGCKMHDLIHDLATFVSSGEYCNVEAGSSKLCSIKCHHLSLVNCDVSFIPSLSRNVKRLHTLLLLGYSFIGAVPDTLFSPLRYVRVLDLSGTYIKNLPSFIGKLKHLRYLKLDGLDIKELPKFVTDLRNLQTLKLNACASLHTLPSGIRKMVKLRHLEIKGTTDLAVLPNGLGKLSTLRTLSKFPVGDENMGCKIGELKDLNLLRGELRIENLERVMNVKDAREAELHKKSDLRVLSLCCNKKSNEEWESLGDDEMKRMDSVLEGLIPPHSNLKELEIIYYAGSKFPSWLEDSRFSSLVQVVLEDCMKCTLMPGLGKLHSLKYLKIIGAYEVKVVGCEFYGIVNDARGKGTIFPKLEELHFKSMHNWEEWKLTEEYGEVMPCLKILEIIDCWKVKATLNWLPSALREVTIRNCYEVIWAPDNPLPHLQHLDLQDVRGMSSKPLPYIPALKALKILGFSCESLPSDGWGRLESLHTLHFCFCSELASLPEGLGQLKALQDLHIKDCERLSSLPEGLGQLKALQNLHIENCERLSSLPEGLGQLKALQTLDIMNCERLSSLHEGLGQLKALQNLHIKNCERLSSLPEGLGQLKALQTLEISHCEQLSSLPEGLGQLKALKTLQIWKCKRLSSLPEGLGQLKSLQTLDIWDCKGLSSLPEGLGQLKALQTLDIRNCERLSSLPEGLGQLKALQNLHIKNCERLSSLPEGLGQLKALQTLKISQCEQLSSLPQGLGQLEALRSMYIDELHVLTSLFDGSERFKSLKCLDIRNCNKLVSLSDGSSHLEALQTLRVHECPNLQSLFHGFELLKSLRRLIIHDCPQLRPLPNLQHLTVLQHLNIGKCPLVTERLEKENNISHVPRIWIDGKLIEQGVGEVKIPSATSSSL